MAASPPPPHLSFLLLLILVLLYTTVTLADQDVSVTTERKKKTYIVRVDHRAKPAVFPVHSQWYVSGAFSGGSEPLDLLHVYDTVFHGFSASLEPGGAAELGRNPAVLAVFEDRVRRLHSTHSPQFLDLRTRLSLWSLSDYGSDVIIGVLDTGIWPKRRSFSDRNLPSVPSCWCGGNDSGPGFPALLCNRKLVGARFFTKGHDAAFPGAAADVGANGTAAEFAPPETPMATGRTLRRRRRAWPPRHVSLPTRCAGRAPDASTPTSWPASTASSPTASTSSPSPSAAARASHPPTT